MTLSQNLRMPFMKGPAPIRRTWNYLMKGDLLFKKNIQIMTVNYNVDQKSSVGAYEFAFWELPRMQFKNPEVQFLKFKNLTPTPYIQFYFKNGENLLVDVYGKSKEEISQHMKNTFCLSKEAEEAEKEKEVINPANFGPKYRRHCICEVPGQVPCPSYVPLPEHMKGIKKPDSKNTES